MGSSKHYCFMFSEILMVVVVVAAAPASLCLGDDAFISTRATYYGSPDCYGNPRGACGFGEYGRTLYDGAVTGVSRLYKNGTRCGACYKVRCKIRAQCSDEGIEVVVTDYGEGDNTDFILSKSAYANLAKPNMGGQLLAYGVVDVEYRRIPCRYNCNFMIKVHERSKFPNYLAILPIYLSQMYDITAVQISKEDDGKKEWKEMRKVYGAVWDMQNPSMGVAMSLRIEFEFVVDGSADSKWAEFEGVIPSNWEAGVAYDARPLIINSIMN